MRKGAKLSPDCWQFSKLQWGRTFSSAERTCQKAAVPARHAASMGPHFFKCGKLYPISSGSQVFFCFNGAALFQVRKDKLKVQPCDKLEVASMGPHFFKCGKLVITQPRRWRESSFNGAALFQVRKGSMEAGICEGGGRLQWGRTFSSAESQHLGLLYRSRASSFNGAALFQVRKVVVGFAVPRRI